MPIRPIPIKPRRLKRTRWQALNKRLADERASFQTPLNDLSFEERNIRVRILMQSAYRMGRRDQRDVIRARHDVTIHLDRPRRRR